MLTDNIEIQHQSDYQEDIIEEDSSHRSNATNEE